MAVDKGGLRYPLGFDYDPKGLLAFKAGVASAMQSVDELRAKAQAGVSMRGLAERTRALASATRESAGAARESAQAMSLQERAANKLDKVQFKLALDEEVRRQAAADGISDVKKKVGALTLEERAQQRLTQIVERRRVQAEAEAQAARQGIELGRQKKVALTAEQQAEENILRKVRQRNVAEIEARLVQAQGIDLSSQKVKTLSAEERATSLINSQIEKQATLQALANRGFNAQGRQVGVEKARAELAALNEEQERASRTGNSLLFTFRRLIGVFAAFAALRAGVAGTIAVVTDAIALNAQLEQARLGVAALLTGVGDVRDATGGTVDAATRLVLAQRESNKQIQQLRKDAVETAASFSELAETFQQALGPGLSAGLDPDQVRRFTVQISQAASALGVASNQLGEEIRSLLTGAITARTTRIATALGITNDDIRRAREAGNLASFLNDRFQAFTTAGKEGLNTFNVILNNLKDTFEQILGAAGLDFFEALKVSLRDIQKALVVRDKDGLLKPRPEVVAILRDALSVLEAAAKVTGFIARNVETVAPIVRAIGSPLSVAAESVDKILSKFTGLAAGGPLANQVKAFVLALTLDFEKFVLITLTGFFKISAAADAALGTTSLRTEVLRLAINSLGQAAQSTLDELNALKAPVAAKQDPFSLLDPIIVGVRRKTEGLAESFKRAGEELRDARIATQLAELRASGATEATLKAAEVSLRSQEQIRRSTLTQVREEATLQKEIADVQAKRLATELKLRIQGLSGSAAQEEIRQVVVRLQKITEARTGAVAAQARNDKAEADALTARADVLERLVQGNYSSQVIEAARERLTLQTQENLALERLNQVQRERKQIEETVSGVQKERLKTIAVEAAAAQAEAARKINLDTAGFAAEAVALFQRTAAQERIVALDGGLGAENRQRQREAEAAANIVALRSEIALLQERQRIERESLDLQIQRTQGAEQAALIAQRGTIDQVNAGNLQEASQRVRLAENEFARIRKEAEQPIEFGLQTALDNLDLSAFQITVDFIGSAIQGLSATIATSLVDAFTDPQADIRESFAQLFKGLATQLTQLLIQAALVRAIGGIAGGFSEGGAVGGTTPAKARGGQVFGGRFKASPAHYGRGVVGLARGGPPPGVAASDTVPAWLTPGEWVMRKLAVLRYGPRFMNAVNQGQVDPVAANALVASTAPAAVPSRSGGYAGGGPVGGGASGSSAILVASEANFETLLNGGKQVLLRFMRDNQAGVRTALAIK